MQPLTSRIWRSPMPLAKVLICSEDEVAAIASIPQIYRDYSRPIEAPLHKSGSGFNALTPPEESKRKRRDDDPARSSWSRSSSRRAAAMAVGHCADRGDDLDADRLRQRARSAHG